MRFLIALQQTIANIRESRRPVVHEVKRLAALGTTASIVAGQLLMRVLLRDIFDFLEYRSDAFYTSTFSEAKV